MTEQSFAVEASNAEGFCKWLLGIGGWAASNMVEAPAVHRLIRSQNPENTVGIPRQDLVVFQMNNSGEFHIRLEFLPLFEAWRAYARRQPKEF